MSQPMVVLSESSNNNNNNISKSNNQQNQSAAAAAAAAAVTTSADPILGLQQTVTTREGNIKVFKNANYNDTLINHYDPDHPRSSKRRCSFPWTQQQQQQPTAAASSYNNRDCYDQITSDDCPSNHLLRHDWFYEIPSICSPSSTFSAPEIVLDSYDNTNHRDGNPDNIVVIGNTTTTTSSNSSLHEYHAECQVLEQQLQQVKRRFQTAAAQCAEATNNYNNNNSNNNFTQSWEVEERTAQDEFCEARSACNPYEILGETRYGGLNHGLFLNRSAIKLANMDAALNFGLTQSLPTLGLNVAAAATTAVATASSEESFYFVDLCAAPGGFSEYILRRFCHSITSGISRRGCRGFGMSLVGENDQGHGTPWKLTQGPLLLGGSHGCLTGVHYTIDQGADGTGDIFQWQNIQSLQQKIMATQYHPECPSLVEPAVRGRVHLVVADGGVDAQRDVDHPECMTQKLVVCQAAAAMSLLRPKGSFVLKLLGCQTTSGVLQCVMQELYDSFECLKVLKPVSSRPASAERYLICIGYRGGSVLPQIQSQPNILPFDGPKWMSRVLLGQIQVKPKLAMFLARVDHDMLQLNLKACFAILSFLEAKTMRLSSSFVNNNKNLVSAAQSKMDEDEDDEAWIQEAYHSYDNGEKNSSAHYNGYDSQMDRRKINIEEFRGAWKLF